MLLIYITVIGVNFRKDKIDVFLVSGNCTSLDDAIQKKAPNDYYKYYNYKIIDLALIKVVQANFKIDCDSPSFLGTEEDKVSKIFEYLETFKYSENQPNPNHLKDDGGNCQAFSLMFKKLCDDSGVECYIKTSDSHMNNLVVVNNRKYKIDVPNKIFEEVN